MTATTLLTGPPAPPPLPRSCREHAEKLLAERFYEHLLSFLATRSFLRDAELVSRLKQTQ